MVYKAAGYFILSGQPIASVVQHVIDKYGRQVRDRAAGNVLVHVAVIYDVYLMENTLITIIIILLLFRIQPFLSLSY